MAYQLVLPDIGEGVVEAEILKWFVKPGDAVAEDQPLVEVMTDKATVTIPSPKRGRVLRLMWKEGDLARVHEPLIEMDLDAPPAARRGPREDAGPGKPAESPVRAAVAAAAAAASPETGSGPGARASEGRAGGIPAGAAAAGRGAASGGVAGAARRKALATPAVRTLARELGVDIEAVGGTGPGGRITKEDLRSRPGQNGRHPAMAAPAPGAAGGAVQGGARGAIEVIPVRGLRRKIAENMARSKRTAAHFTFVEQVDVSELVRAKERMAKAASAEGVKVTFLPFVVKAAVAALKRFPQLNASFDEERGEIQLKRWYDIGVAAATEQGLAVPVLRRADQRSILEAAREIDRLAAETRAGKLRPEDVGGSTFTITSLGALGGLFATPVINFPEVAILGVHRIRPTPVVRDGQVVVRDVMHLSVTSDHRVVDGHQAAAFAYEVIRYLEDPNLLFMQMV